MISLLRFLKEDNSLTMKVELQFLIFAHHLIMLYICIKFHKNISKDFRNFEWILFPCSNFQRGIIL